jgi:haloalkane dehalogenase
MNTLLRFSFLVGLVTGLAACSSTQTATTNHLKFVIDRDLLPYASHFVTLDNGSRIHYLEEGNQQKPTLLLLHGNPTWSFLYRHIIDHLKDDFHLVAPDYPGFGLSTAPHDYGFTAAEHAKTLQAFVQKLDLKDMIIMVQDWGGPIGFDLALNEPDRVKGFVISNTWAWPLERTGQKAFSTIMGGWTGQLGAWCCNGIVRVFMSRGVVNKLDEKVLAMYHAPFAERAQRSPTHIFPAQLKDAHVFLQSIHEGLPTLADKPALLVWGEQDFAFQTPERERFEAIFPKHQTVLLKNAGHFVQEDAPDTIAEAILGWFPSLKQPPNSR